MDITRCFDIGGSKVVVADVSSAGDVEVLDRFATPVDSFDQFSDALLAHCPSGDAPISISIAGVIHPNTGVLQSSNIPSTSGREIASELNQRLAREVTIINDANAFALAESKFGRAKEHDVVLAIILGTGVGGGIVINDQVLKGSYGTAGEWGHGPACTSQTKHELPAINCAGCHQPCVDTFGGARGIERLYEQIASKQLDSRSILQLWESGDHDASRVVEVWLDIVGGALANVVNVLGPSIVAVGGGLANNSALIDCLNDAVQERGLSQSKSKLLYCAVSGPEQGLLGAALHAQANRMSFVQS